MKIQASYPTVEHERAAAAITEFFAGRLPIEAVLLVNSCARGQATRDSCLDIVVLTRPEILSIEREEWQAKWEAFDRTNSAIQAMVKVGRYSVVHLDIIDGVFVPEERDEAAGPDSFEVAIGNLLVYSVPLWQNSDYLAHLKRRWLPYYDEDLRQQRLCLVRQYCLNNLNHIPLYLERGLYFQSFDRLYNAYREFLQALFIACRTYPIAYNKWIHEQIVDILGMPELYARLVHLLEIKEFESTEMAVKAVEVEQLLEEYTRMDETR
jgi:predicted nucleotidyltransferase